MVSASAFRTLAMSFDGVREEPHFHRTSFRIGNKIFATMDEGKGEVMVKLSPAEQSVFCDIDREMIYPVPGKWGLNGSTFIALKKVKKDILTDAVQRAYQGVSGKNKKAGR
jgi:predicted DNA-binding protein (MmcQ/YjbR family)